MISLGKLVLYPFHTTQMLTKIFTDLNLQIRFIIGYSAIFLLTHPILLLFDR